MNFVNTSLFVGDLPKFCTESDLEQFFSTYGPVLDVKIKRNVNTGKTLSYGFVTLSTEALAAEAIRAFDGAMFLGRKMRVRWAMYNAKTQNPINQNVINSVYVRFVTQKMDQYVTEEDLHHVFDPFGGVLDVSIKESSIDVRTNRQSGYGFVHFSCDNMGIESAFQAVAALDNATIDGITFNVELSKNLLKQFNSDGTPIVTPRKEEVSQNSFSMNSGASSATKTLTSPSRSMNSIYQPASFQSTPLRNCYPDAEQTVAADLTSPFRSNGLGDQVSRTPLRNCSSMNAIKMSPSHYHRSPISSGENTLPRTHSGRMERGLNSTMLSSSPVVSSPHHFALNPPPGIVHSGAGLVGSPVSAMQNKFPSRENSFRSMGGRSASGSFRTLNARSSSANSMTSSYGTTVSCTSSPSPFANVVPIDNSNFDKVQSFRSDPGANRVYGTRTHLGHAFDQSSQLLGQSSHSLSFHESPLSRSLFTMRNAQHGGSDISLLSVPEKATLTDFGSSSYLPQSAFEPSNRPESRASDCSDVSTDSESAVLVLSAKESGLDFFSSNTNESEDFFAFLATGNNSSNKLPLESVMKTAAEVGKALPDSFELSSHSLNLEKMNLSVSAFPPFATEAPTSLSNMLL